MGQLHGRGLVPVTAVVKQRENNFNGIIESCLLFSHSILLFCCNYLAVVHKCVAEHMYFLQLHLSSCTLL